MFKTKIRKEGNSAVITLSSEMLAVLGVAEGDTVYVTPSDQNGLKIHAQDLQFKKPWRQLNWLWMKTALFFRNSLRDNALLF